MGKEGLKKLSASTVLVLGCGGVGSNCVEALARGGVGKIIVADHDVVSESNINRQAIAFHSTIGRPKVEVMEQMIHDINPDIEVVALKQFVLKENLSEFLDTYATQADYVVDAIDTISAKLALAEQAQVRKDMKLISSMGGANKLCPECFRFSDLKDTVNCPMCRIMRKEARKRGIEHLRVLYSCERPVSTTAKEGATRRERTDLGTASFIPPIMGQMIAGEVIKELAGINDVLRTEGHFSPEDSEGKSSKGKSFKGAGSSAGSVAGSAGKDPAGALTGSATGLAGVADSAGASADSAGSASAGSPA